MDYNLSQMRLQPITNEVPTDVVILYKRDYTNVVTLYKGDYNRCGNPIQNGLQPITNAVTTYHKCGYNQCCIPLQKGLQPML